MDVFIRKGECVFYIIFSESINAHLSSSLLWLDIINTAIFVFNGSCKQKSLHIVLLYQSNMGSHILLRMYMLVHRCIVPKEVFQTLFQCFRIVRWAANEYVIFKLEVQVSAIRYSITWIQIINKEQLSRMF